MFDYRITKYNPENRDLKGTYTTSDWTSISDINRSIEGKTLSFNTYLKIENKYVEAIDCFLTINKIEQMKICFLEKNISEKELMEIIKDYPDLYATEFLNVFNLIENNMMIGRNKINIVSRLILREHIWAKLENEDNLFIHFGYDYYMYLRSQEIMDKTVENLYFEKIKSPYIT